jgi:methionyl-tRNA synthetase
VTTPADDGPVGINIETFAQVDLRVGQIVVAERIPNADRLLRLEVDLAEPVRRQILAGIAEYYTPEELIGQKILVVSNLQPRKLRGLESRGMLLAASSESGRPLLATVPPETPNGSRLR